MLYISRLESLPSLLLSQLCHCSTSILSLDIRRIYFLGGDQFLFYLSHFIIPQFRKSKSKSTIALLILLLLLPLLMFLLTLLITTCTRRWCYSCSFIHTATTTMASKFVLLPVHLIINMCCFCCRLELLNLLQLATHASSVVLLPVVFCC